jgi:hypothetical protein
MGFVFGAIRRKGGAGALPPAEIALLAARFKG